MTKKKAGFLQQSKRIKVHSPLFAVLHGTVNGVAGVANDITPGTAIQQSFDRFNASQTAGDVKRRFPSVVKLVHSRAQPGAHHLEGAVNGV